MISDIKLFALYYINEHKNLSYDEKIMLANYVKESNIDNLSYLLATGEMINEDFSPTNFRISPELQDKWEKAAAFKDAFSKGQMAGMTAAVIAAAVAALSYKAYKSYLSKAARACSGKKGAEKTSCMQKFKVQATKEKIKVLQNGMASKCSKSKDPNACKKNIQKKINKEKAKLGEL